MEITLISIALIGYILFMLNYKMQTSKNTEAIKRYTNELVELSDSFPNLVTCRPVVVKDVYQNILMNAQKLISTNMIDTKAVSDFKIALNVYQSKLTIYNKLPSCSVYCVNGTVNATYRCVCNATSTAFPRNEIIYCVPNTFLDSKNSYFDTRAGTYLCITGYQRTNQKNSDYDCYNAFNTTTVASQASLFSRVTSMLNNITSMVSQTYGFNNSFYIIPQADFDDLSTPAFKIRKENHPGLCAENALPSATFFTYNMQTRDCKYYNSPTIPKPVKGKYIIGTKKNPAPVVPYKETVSVKPIILPNKSN